MMHTKIKLLGSVLVFAALTPIAPMTAQQRGTVSGTVRTATGDSLPFAIVRATADNLDTLVRLNARGQYSIVLPFGAAHLRATSVGYDAADRDIAIDSPALKVDFEMRRSAQQLSEVNVRDHWNGIRGVVGDTRTDEPLARVRLRDPRHNIHVVTDSLGHFQIELPRAEETTLMLERDGYLSSVAHVVLRDNEPADIILYMTRGKDSNDRKGALMDLGSREAFKASQSFVANNEVMTRYGAKDLLQGIRDSGMLDRKSMQLQFRMCLFVDGVPQRNMAVNSVRLKDVEFVEVYTGNADETGSLALRWPHDKEALKCSENYEINSGQKEKLGSHNNNVVKYVSVWLKH